LIAEKDLHQPAYLIQCPS